MRLLLGLFLGCLSLWAQATPVLTRSNSNDRHGVYLNEAKLTPANVFQLRELRRITIPNDARGLEAQPLVLPRVTQVSDGSVHDVLVLTSMANDVIGCDLHTGAVLWTTHLGTPIKGNKGIDFWMINDHWGIASTGVIDPDTQTVYVISWMSPDSTPQKGWHSLHSISLTSGKETRPPLSMNPLTYNPGYGLPVHHFAGQMRKQRSALLLEKVAGHKIVALFSGSVLETAQAASGWGAVADLDTWRFTASWASTGRYTGGGIWMAGQGPSADASGDLFFTTGNGGFDGITDFSEAFVRLHYTPPTEPRGMGTLKVTDWWAGWSDAGRVGQDPTLPAPRAIGAKLAGLNSATSSGQLQMPVNHGHPMAAMPAAANPQYAGFSDQDLGSGAAVLISQYHLMGGAGKDGIWYSVNTNQMGKTMPADFANSALNYAKLLAPPVWFTYACFKHDAQGHVIGYETTTPANMDYLDFNYDNLTHHMHSTPVVFESASQGTLIYCFGENGNLRAFRVNPDGSLTFLANGAEQASANSPRNPGGMPGAMLALSANGTQNAILWALIPLGDANKEVTQGYLAAYDATNFGKYSDGAGSIKLLWKGPLITYNKFNVPVIDDGLVIVPTYDARVIEYGLQ
jgi:hypothetical protein